MHPFDIDSQQLLVFLSKIAYFSAFITVYPSKKSGIYTLNPVYSANESHKSLLFGIVHPNASCKNKMDAFALSVPLV